MTGWSWGSLRTDHVQLQVSKLGVLKPPVCSICQGWWVPLPSAKAFPPPSFYLQRKHFLHRPSTFSESIFPTVPLPSAKARPPPSLLLQRKHFLSESTSFFNIVTSFYIVLHRAPSCKHTSSTLYTSIVPRTLRSPQKNARASPEHIYTQSLVAFPRGGPCSLATASGWFDQLDRSSGYAL